MKNNTPKIILVDDNAFNLCMEYNALKDYYEVYTASSAGKLFYLLEEVTPNLILLDIEMPYANGYEAFIKLKSDARFAGIPVIFLTGYTEEAYKKRGLQLGAADCICKSYPLALLVNSINENIAA